MHAGLLTAAGDTELTHDVMNSFYLLVLLVYLLSMLSIFILSVLLSHRIYGPVYGFENYMSSLFEKKGGKIGEFSPP